MSTELAEVETEFSESDWAQIEPRMSDLADRPLTADNLAGWLADWSFLRSALEETNARLEVAVSADVADSTAEARFDTFRDQVYAPAMVADQRIKRHLLDSGLPPPPGFEVALRNMRVEADLFCEENLPLQNKEQALVTKYNKILGAQTAVWEGEEVTLYELEAQLQDPSRETRERAFRTRAERQLVDREAINDVWSQLVSLRTRMARNAGLKDYLDFRWQQLCRCDYTPKDCSDLHRAVQTVVAPAVSRIYGRYRQQLGVTTLRPWDLEADPSGKPPLRPFENAAELEEKGTAIFRRIDPVFGDYLNIMRRERLLDLDNRRNKAPHGWCATYPLVRKPFLFMNAIGWQRDVIIFLHEAGHAFHVFEMAKLPYFHQLDVPAEFLEVASMSIELLAGPYLVTGEGGFYSEEDARRARIKHLEDGIIVSWPFIAAMDAFQHWAYTNPDVAVDAAASSAKWTEIWLRFMPGVDWSGLEEELAVSWQSIPHFFGWPLSGTEYAVAQMGAVQVWRNALADGTGALTRFREALSLGNTVPLPELYRAAGAELAFDSGTLRHAVALMEHTISELGREV